MLPASFFTIIRCSLIKRWDLSACISGVRLRLDNYGWYKHRILGKSRKDRFRDNRSDDNDEWDRLRTYLYLFAIYRGYNCGSVELEWYSRGNQQAATRFYHSERDSCCRP